MTNAVSFRNPAAELPPGGLPASVLAPLMRVAVALGVVALPLMANSIHLGFGLVTLLILVVPCALLSPPLLVLVILCGFTFQNTIVSLLSDLISSKAEFDMMRAYNFFALCLGWLCIAAQFVAGRFACPPALARFLKATTAVLLLIGVYFLIGFALYGTLAIVNLRNVATPLLLFQICLVVVASRPVRFGPVLTVIGVLLLFCGFSEFFFRQDWLAMTNGYAYWDHATGTNWETLILDKQARETGIYIGGRLETFRVALFNSPLFSDFDIEMMRLFGPNIHAISFAYCLAFFTIFTLFRGRFLQALAFLVLLVLTSTKGPLLIVLLTGASWIVLRLLGSRIALLLHFVLLAAYAVAGLIVGLGIGDFHALGLMAGLQDFAANPLGRGIGAGGNLSPLFATIDWYAAQAAGRTPFPVESSIGVLLYQMGVFAFVVIGAYFWIGCQVLKLARDTGNALQGAFAFAILTLATNGLFQEEAYFAPLALATYLAMAAIMLGAAIREGAIAR